MKRRIRRGITLIELVIVISLISIMIALLSSSIPALLKSASNENSEKLQVYIDFAYNFAMLKNNLVILEADLDKNQLTIYSLEESEKGLQRKKLKSATLASSARIIKIYDMRGIEYNRGKIEVPFNFNGISENYIFCMGNESEIEISLLNYKYNRKIEVKKGEITSFENPEK